MFCNFSLKMNMANRTHVVFALWARKLMDTLNKRKTKFALTCKVQKVIRALAFRSREKFGNSFFQNCWYNLLASSISFNLIWVLGIYSLNRTRYFACAQGTPEGTL